MAAPYRACIRSAHFIDGCALSGLHSLRSCYFKWMIEVFRIIKDALAGIARDDLVVAPDFLKYLRPDPNLANFADFITSCRDGDSTTSFADPLVARKQIRRDRGLDLLSLF